VVAVFAAVAPMTGMSWEAYGMHFAACGLVLAVTFGLFAMGGMGGGDAKLLAATSLWMGFGFTLLQYLVFTTLIGGALTMAIISYRKSAMSVFTAHNPFLRHFADDKNGVPYGIALGIGGMLVFPASPLVVWALEQAAAN
jgi:prepilin peptidase CpaA